MPLPLSLTGETRVETRNTIYRLRDGVCYAVERVEVGIGLQHDPTAFVGMRVVGWMRREDTAGVLSLEWEPGSYAVLWRPRAAPTDRSAVALTSASIAFLRVERATAGIYAQPSGHGRPAAQSALPLAILRPAPLPRGVSPAIAARPAPAPMPAERSPAAPPRSPPPLPARQRAVAGGAALGVRPLPYRVPTVLS